MLKSGGDTTGSTDSVQSTGGTAPGKVTRTAAIQRKAAPAASPDDAVGVRDAASAGTAGAGGALPHGDAIQRSFGRHDVSAIQSHQDGAAAAACDAMGARAFATGNDVAFLGLPDLHTAAHEAAHVVQQRAGLTLDGGVGQAGDVHERHADAVADLVVAGASAVDLLAPFAGGPDGAGDVVQRKGPPSIAILGVVLTADAGAEEFEALEHKVGDGKRVSLRAAARHGGAEVIKWFVAHGVVIDAAAATVATAVADAYAAWVVR